jgi:DNA-binding transcriptional MerR regulator
MKQQFSTRDVMALTGITARQLQWWDEQGIVAPRHEGHRRLYSLDDLAEVAVLCQLRRKGFSLQRMRKVMQLLQREFGKRLAHTVTADSEYHLLTDGTHIYLEKSPQQIVDILRHAKQPILSVCLTDAVRQIRAEIRKRSIPVNAVRRQRARKRA